MLMTSVPLIKTCHYHHHHNNNYHDSRQAPADGKFH